MKKSFYLKLELAFILFSIFFCTFLLSCSSINNVNHTSKEAFLNWYGKPHYEVAAFTTFDYWKEIESIKGLDETIVRKNDTVKAYKVLDWDEDVWYLIIQKQNSNPLMSIIIYQEPINSYTKLDSTLVIDLYPPTVASYSDYRESSINFYWVSDCNQPLIEFVTNGPAKSNLYLLEYQKRSNSYKLILKQ